ncbi:hypothetical protein COOONC_08355 [Cooperia oncophora]
MVERRFLRLMRGFDAEDVEVIRKAVESGGVDAKASKLHLFILACAPGPPMDERPDDDQPEEDSGLIPQIDRPMSMPYLCCKLWRWKDLQTPSAARDGPGIYHFLNEIESRLTNADSGVAAML